MAAGSDGSGRGEGNAGESARRANPMNRLVPYLDLFSRLGDDELARLAGIDASMVATLRHQVNEICDGLIGYVDLLPRLGDEELVRLSGASIKTIRFWRLCQPRTSPRVPGGAEISSVTPMPRPIPIPIPPPIATPNTAVGAPPRAPARAREPARSGAPVAPRGPSGGIGTQPTILPTLSNEYPVADWSNEAAATNAMRNIAASAEPPPASWDAAGPAAGVGTMVTPIAQRPSAPWGDASPSLTATQPGARPTTPERTGAALDPAESQQSAALLMNFDGAPFPGYEERDAVVAAVVEDDSDFTVELER